MQPQRAAPTAFLAALFGSVKGQARFHGCGGHRIAQDRNCPVGAGLLTRPPFVDHDARRARRLKGRSTQRWPKNSENRREGQAPPLRDEGGKVPQQGTGESGTRPYGVFNSPIWFRRDRCGFMAAAVAISPRTEIAL